MIERLKRSPLGVDLYNCVHLMAWSTSLHARCNQGWTKLSVFMTWNLCEARPSISWVTYSCWALACLLTHVRLFAILWTAAHHAPLSMGFSRQEYWRGLPFLSPGDLPNPGRDWTQVSPVLAGEFFTTSLENPLSAYYGLKRPLFCRLQFHLFHTYSLKQYILCFYRRNSGLLWKIFLQF